MQCEPSPGGMIYDYFIGFSPILQHSIMLGFLSIPIIVALALHLLPKSAREWVSGKIQSWLGSFCFVAIISILAATAIEANYWTSYVIPCNTLEGIINSTKSVSMIGVFTLQIIFLAYFFLSIPRYMKKNSGLLERTGNAFSSKIKVLNLLFHNTNKDLSKKIPLYITVFPKISKVRRKDVHSTGQFGVWAKHVIPMTLGAMYSLLSAGFYWLKLLTEQLGIIDLELNIELLGINIGYETILQQLSNYNSRYYFDSPFISIGFLLLFMFRFKLYPRWASWIKRLF